MELKNKVNVNYNSRSGVVFRLSWKKDAAKGFCGTYIALESSGASMYAYDKFLFSCSLE